MCYSVLCAVAALGLGAAEPAAQIESQSTRVGGKTLYQWINEIVAQDPGVRENAIRTVLVFADNNSESMRRAVLEAVPNLVRELSDKDTSLRVNAAIAIRVIGLGKDEATIKKGVTALKYMALNDPQTIVRYHAAMALGTVGHDAKAAVANLRNTIADQGSWEIRKAAAFALGRLAGDEDEGPDPGAIKALCSRLTAYEPCAQVRLEAIMSLIMLGPPADKEERAAAIKVLKGAFNDRDKTVAVWAHTGVIRMDKTETQRNLTSIGLILKNPPDVQTKIQAIRALGTIGPEAKALVADIIEELNNNDPGVVLWAIWALGNMKASGIRALPELDKLNKQHKEEAVRQAAAEAIKAITQREDQARKKPVEKKVEKKIERREAP